MYFIFEYVMFDYKINKFEEKRYVIYVRIVVFRKFWNILRKLFWIFIEKGV